MNLKIALLSITLVCCTQSLHGQGVHFMLGGINLTNNSRVLITDIGRGENALLCITDNTNCCFHPNRAGEWFYPNGSIIPNRATGHDFFRGRGYKEVYLSRRNNDILSPIGQYRCDIPDRHGVTQTLQITVTLGVHFMLGGINLTNNSHVLITDIGTGENALLCVTDNTSCCIPPNRAGEWFYPNGSIIPNQAEGHDLFKVRGPSVVHLNRWNNDTESPIGQYSCIIPDSDGINQTLLITITLSVHFMLGGISLTNNSHALFTDIGRGENALLCVTDNTNCCIPPNERAGEWFYPNGSIISNQAKGHDFFKGRGPSVVHLNRWNNDTQFPIGQYSCIIPDSDGINQTLLITITLRLHFMLGGISLTNNSHVLITDIGRDENALFCVTDNTNCCNSYRAGEWFYPNGSIVPNQATGHEFFRGRDISVIRLSRRNDAASPTGQYRCVIPDSNGVSRTLYIAVGFRVSSVVLKFNLNQPPTLTCTVLVEPLYYNSSIPLSVIWSGPVYGTGEFNTNGIQRVSDTTYVSRAIFNSQGAYYDSGTYTCTTDEDIPSTTEVLLRIPHRPVVNYTHNEQSLHYLSWTQNEADIVTSYELTYVHHGPCPHVQRRRETIQGGARDYNTTGLHEYSNYTYTLRAVNSTGMSPPFIGELFSTLSKAPTSGPQSFTATLFSTNITIHWGRIDCLDRNSEITHYSVRQNQTNSNKLMTTTVYGTNDSERVFTVNRLEPLTSNMFEVAGVNMDGERGPFSTISVITTAPEVIAIQLHIYEVSNCWKWTEAYTTFKLRDIVSSTVEAVNDICPRCSLTSGDLIEPFLMCFPQSVHQVTFRAQLKDRSQATAREIVTYIEEWITSSSTGARLTVHGIRFYLNNSCIVLLSTIDDPECPGYLTDPQPLTTSASTPPTTYKELDTEPSTTQYSTETPTAPSASSTTDQYTSDQDSTTQLDLDLTMKSEPTNFMETTSMTPSLSVSENPTLISPQSNTDTIIAIVGVVAAIIIVLILSIAAVIIFLALVRHSGRKYTLKHQGLSKPIEMNKRGQNTQDQPEEAVYDLIPEPPQGGFKITKCPVYQTESRLSEARARDSQMENSEGTTINEEEK